MLERLVVVLALLGLSSNAVAGQRCKQRPEPIYYDGEIDVHPNGNWHRDFKSSGKLSRAALERFVAFQDSGAARKKVTRCLEALIKNEKSKAAKRACKVTKKKAR